MPHLSAGKLCGVRWYQFTGYVGIISGPETITCEFFVSDVFGRLTKNNTYEFFLLQFSLNMQFWKSEKPVGM